MSLPVAIDNSACYLESDYVPGSGIVELQSGYGLELLAKLAEIGVAGISPDRPLRFTLIEQGANGIITPNTREAKYKATGISGDTLTGVLLAEGTDQEFYAGDVFAVLWSAGFVEDLVQAIEDAADDSTVVHTTGNETIAGTKTFTSTIQGNISGSAASATTATLATTATTAATATNVTGTVAIANGGTGQTTAAAAINALLPSQTGNSGKFLTTNGTAAAWNSLSVSPGGTTGQLQYNNAGAFAGASWSTIATNGALLTATTAANTDKPIVLIGKATTATITNIAITSNVATITTSAAHGFVVGREVALSDLTTVSSLNGQRLVILSVASTTFTAWCAVSSQASAAETGTATSQTSTVPAMEIQDGSGRATVRIYCQPSGTRAGASVTSPMWEAAAFETWNHATQYQNTPRVFPWMTYHSTSMNSFGLSARIAIRGGYSATTTYDAAAIDLGLTENGNAGRIRFYVGGNGNGNALVYAGEFGSNGRLSLAQPLVMVAATGQNCQIGYSNNVDTSASLFLGTNSNKGLVLQTPQLHFTNPFELQLGGGNTVVGGITYQGNWWMGTPATNNGTTRLIVSPRQTTDIGLMVAGIASQTGAQTSKLIALAGRSSTTDNVPMAYIGVAWSVDTHASRLADLVLTTTGYGGDHEAIRFSDTGGIAQPIIPIANIRDAADDAAAAALSPAVPVGGLYRTGSVLKIRVS